MSLQSANQFVSATISNPELMDKVITAASGKAPDAAAQTATEIGNSAGYDFTAAEVTEAREAYLKSQALSENDLDNVAGGAGGPFGINPGPTGGGFVMPEIKPGKDGGGIFGTSQTAEIKPGTIMW